MGHRNLLTHPFTAHTWLLIVLLSLTGLSTGAAIQSSNWLTKSHNLTSLGLQLNATSGSHYCTRSQDWMTPEFDEDDCQAAINIFRQVEERQHGHGIYEFTLRGTYPDHPQQLETQFMPRKYASSMSKTAKLVL